MSNFNTLLYRQLQNGHQFTAYFPKATNLETNLGKGNTFHSVAAIKKMVLQHFKQCQNIAPLLKGPTLKETTINIYSFLYNHIQYNQDNALQQLRTPANSWQNRSTGIDCKSYSLFASCILTCLGIKHAIRQIKQPAFKQNLYTHVYIVVPINQQTGNVESGYYVIDATVKNNREPLFIQKHDTNMSVNLEHVGLNGTRKRATKKTTKTTAKRKPVAKKRATTERKKSSGFLKGALLTGLGLALGVTLSK